MPDTIAERLLRLVASCEEASAIAGDLRELAATRGELWFWFAIMRTVPSLLWKDLTSAPWFFAFLGFRGLLVTVFLGGLISFITFGLPFRVGMTGTLSTAAWLGTIALVQFTTGLYLANKSRGREIAAILAYVGVYNFMRLGGVLTEAAIQSSKVAVTPWDIGHALTAGALGHGLVDQLAMIMKFAPLFLAAILARYRRSESLSSVVRL